MIAVLVVVPMLITTQRQAEAAGVNSNYITFSDAYMSNTSAWGIRWGVVGATLSISDIPGPGVQFDIGNTTNKMGIGDVYPVQIPGVGDDLTGFGGCELYLKNTGSAGLNAHLYMNTGYSAGADWRNDTFWGGPWIWLNPGETKLYTLNFSYAEAWNAEDDPVVEWQVPGGTWTNVKRLNQVTNIGFEILGAGNFRVVALGSSDPKLYVEPPNVTKSPSDNDTLFSVDIAIENFTDLYAFDINMTWDSSLLRFESAAYTTQLDNLWGAGNWNPVIATSTAGSYKLVATKLGAGGNSSINPYVLFSLTLRIINVSSSPLQTTIHFSLVKLSDSMTPTPNSIVPASVTDGTYYMNPLPEADVAITNVDVAKTIVCQGFGMNVSVIVFNQGGPTVTFDLTLYANASVIEMKTITLTSSGHVVVTFVWNTTGYSKGIYGIWAYAQPLPGETDLADNNCTDGNVRVTDKGDIAPEFGIVDIFDIVTVASTFGSVPGDYNWNPVADTNNDGIVDIFDIVVVASHFV